jgi:CRP-like cAMP-binding protein
VKTFHESALGWARLQELFRHCSDERVTSFLTQGHWLARPAGTFFFLEGDYLDTFFLLESGCVSAYQLTDDGRKAPLKYVRPGEPFGLASILPFSRNFLSAQAVTDSAALAWHRDIVQQMVQSNSQLAFNIARILARSYEELAERYVCRARPLQDRVAWALAKLANQIGKQEGSQLVIAEGFNETELADLAGTTIYSVSRILSEWQRKKILEKRRGGWMVVSDIRRLNATLKPGTRKR